MDHVERKGRTNAGIFPMRFKIFSDRRIEESLLISPARTLISFLKILISLASGILPQRDRTANQSTQLTCSYCRFSRWRVTSLFSFSSFSSSSPPPPPRGCSRP